MVLGFITMNLVFAKILPHSESVFLTGSKRFLYFSCVSRWSSYLGLPMWVTIVLGNCHSRLLRCCATFVVPAIRKQACWWRFRTHPGHFNCIVMHSQRSKLLLRRRRGGGRRRKAKGSSQSSSTRALQKVLFSTLTLFHALIVLFYVVYCYLSPVTGDATPRATSHSPATLVTMPSNSRFLAFPCWCFTNFTWYVRSLFRRQSVHC